MLNAYLTTHLEIIPASGALGAELQGINLADPVAPDTASAIRGALAEHGVIFPAIGRLRPNSTSRLPESLAPININRFFKTASGYPQISEVRKEPASRRSESESSILPLSGQHAQCRLVVTKEPQPSMITRLRPAPWPTIRFPPKTHAGHRR